MTASFRFSDFLAASQKAWSQCCSEDNLLSLALPINGVDPLQALPSIRTADDFRVLWDSAPGLCLAATGRCQQFELTGTRRFELAQRFCDLTLARLQDASPDAPPQARPRVLLAFSFFEDSSERLSELPKAPSVEAVLPRWQLTSHGRRGWLRLNATTSSLSEARDLAEQCWLMAEAIQNAKLIKESGNPTPQLLHSSDTIDAWQNRYREPLNQAIQLIETGELHKIVLAVRHTIPLTRPLNTLQLLQRLRRNQTGSCRFLWQRHSDDSFFGASPERLLSLRGGYLRSDALAGTASADDDGSQLLRSGKDRREHELVVETITRQLSQFGLKPWRRRQPQLARHGSLTHLHTPISANARGYSPLKLAQQLHPTPAVAGLPGKDALKWLRVLEPFERGNYAAPIGWIDSNGDAELRVAIRCGHALGHNVDLTAGAGLVLGSSADREMSEIQLKLSVLSQELKDSCTTYGGDAG
jgi:menaquinone-specific isochorismate synthase